MAATVDKASPARPARLDRRHLYGPTLVTGLLGAGGLTVAATKPWVRATATVPSLPPISASVSGADLVPLAGALGVALLAAFGAVVATRGVVRRLIGAAIMVAALVVIIAGLRPGVATAALTDGLAAKGWSQGPFTTSTTPWRWLTVGCALLVAPAGALTAAYGDRWAEMGSRYEAPKRAIAPAHRHPEALTETDVWRAIDQGRDPTHET